MYKLIQTYIFSTFGNDFMILIYIRKLPGSDIKANSTGQYIKILIHKSYIFAHSCKVKFFKITPSDLDNPRIIWIKSHSESEQCAFPTTRWANNHSLLTRLKLKTLLSG